MYQVQYLICVCLKKKKERDKISMRGDSILCLYYGCKFGIVEVGASMIAKRALTGCPIVIRRHWFNSLRKLGADQRESHEL